MSIPGYLHFTQQEVKYFGAIINQRLPFRSCGSATWTTRRKSVCRADIDNVL